MLLSASPVMLWPLPPTVSEVPLPRPPQVKPEPLTVTLSPAWARALVTEETYGAEHCAAATVPGMATLAARAPPRRAAPARAPRRRRFIARSPEWPRRRGGRGECA